MTNGKKIYELKTIHDSRKSFYGKAQVLEDGNDRTLYSYNTRIMTYDTAKRCYIIHWRPAYWTATTGRHIMEFAHQMTGQGINKAGYTDLYIKQGGE